MSVLAKKYNKYKDAQGIYVKRRRELLKEPEEELSQLSEDLQLFKLKKDVEALLEKKMKKAWRLYKKVYDGSPSEIDIETFLVLADDIMKYEDFISADQLKLWKVSRDLIWAYKTAFKGTQDELDQISIVGD